MNARHQFLFVTGLLIIFASYNLTSCMPSSGAAKTKTVTLIHMGDVHGHMVPRPHLRSDGNGELQGGLARLYTRIQKIRAKGNTSLLFNTGDTIQGSAEALYTRGQALVDVINRFGIDYFAPGNWEFVYGTQRFRELFAGVDGNAPGAPWNALAANLYYSGAPYLALQDQRVLPPYAVFERQGIKFGVIGFTTERGPKVIGSEVVEGFRFTKGDAEMAEFVPLLRDTAEVDVLIVISELGLANNIRLAEANPGIDIILSSDMHEETREPYLTSTGTMIVEQGQDGTRLGEITIEFDNRNNKTLKYKQHLIDTSIDRHAAIANLVDDIRKPFLSGTDFISHTNPINGTVLDTPIDTVIGQASVALHRSNYAHEPMPAVIEGTSHNFLADVFKEMTNADLGVIRGFRYGTHIAPGDIKLEDIYHYVAIGPFIASGQVSGQQVKNIIENSAAGSLNGDVAAWGGGWLFGWSGLRFDLDPYAAKGSRASNVEVYDRATGQFVGLDLSATYTLGGYNYASEPNLINKAPVIAGTTPVVYTNKQGAPVDGTQVVVDYLANRPANPGTNRISLLKPLPPAVMAVNPEMQPIKGVQ